jgi:hypothetical protein
MKFLKYDKKKPSKNGNFLEKNMKIEIFLQQNLGSILVISFLYNLSIQIVPKKIRVHYTFSKKLRPPDNFVAIQP